MFKKRPDSEQPPKIDDGLKQRLIGAVVIIILAVIFLPALFRGEGQQTLVKTVLIPEPPKTPTIRLPERQGVDDIGKALVQDSRRVEQLEQASTSPFSSSQTSSQTPTISTPQVSGQAPASDAIHPSAATTREADSESIDKAMSDSLDEQLAAQQRLSSQSSLSEQSLLDSQGASIAWTIQVASFNDEGNAVALRDRLQEAGMTAYLRHRWLTEERRVSRVYVGPMADRERLQPIMATLDKEFALKGLIVRYSPQ